MNSKWLVLFAIWLMMVVAYFDRVNMAVAGPSVMASLHLTKTQLGFVIAAFTLGYAVMQAPGGFLADRFGARRLLISAILVWSFFTGLTGLAMSFAAMVAIRILFGLGEGLENGAQFKLIGEHFSEKEHSFANAVFLSSIALGPAVATPVAASLIENYGWRSMFFDFAGAGLVVGFVLFRLLPSGPTQPADEPGLGSGRRQTAGFREFAANPACLLCVAGYLLFNIAFWGFLSWVPAYLSLERHITLKQLGWAGAAPYFAGFVGMLIIGRLGSGFFDNRKGYLLAFCFFASSLGLYAALSALTASSCVIGLSVAAFFMYSVFGPIWSIAIGLSPADSRGAFTGAVNFFGQIGGFVSQITIGYLADSMKTFTGAILFMIGALALGGIAMVALQGRIAVEAPVSIA